MNKPGEGGEEGTGWGVGVPIYPCTGYLDACLREQLAGQVGVEGRGHGQHGQVLGVRCSQTTFDPINHSQTNLGHPIETQKQPKNQTNGGSIYGIEANRSVKTSRSTVCKKCRC
jgi:hypothetical protein